ncbi:SPFH/Band 7/PHB domain protein [Acholeplasma equirhinis]|uniref:SPFH domain-containing protein n=1 Tax=Acholeplasma equirhinis TaxID=555393 RepID=UPI00197AF84A|nr:SPFH domain-containing protein [Acholeplasma equirhinis]MBN3490502.1 SPFH/Band 7/PHB domain protein [Acholeplasma equirhinis]
METLLIVLAVLLVIAALILVSGFRVVNQTNKYIVQRLGAYHATWGVGIHFLIPFIDRVVAIVNLKEQVKDFDPQAVITKDNVTMQIDTIVFYQVTDPKLYAYGVDNPVNAIEALSATTLRNIIGELDLDATLTSRDIINTKMRDTLDEATDKWGIKVNRVEVKNIMPPKDIRESMEKQMRAEREKRQTILIAEGEKRAKILEAEGHSESVILRAEAEKRQVILQAEAEAEQIEKLKRAEALGIQLIKEAGADEAVLKIKAFEALAKLAEGQSTKIVVPSNLAELAGVVTALADTALPGNEKAAKKKAE